MLKQVKILLPNGKENKTTISKALRLVGNKQAELLEETDSLFVIRLFSRAEIEINKSKEENGNV